MFIYACPSASKVKSRMVHSSAARGCVHVAESLGVKVLKRVSLAPSFRHHTRLLIPWPRLQLETSDPEEVTDAWIEDALGPAVEPDVGKFSLGEGSGEATPPSSGMMTPTAPLDRGEGKTFAKPARPGRKR